MQIELNGKPHPLPDGATLDQLIADLSLVGRAVAVAVNRQVVPSAQWSSRALAEADKVDVVRASGGG